jgi:3-oxoacyl-[acyl-carrier-protein] synthase II
MMNVMTAFINGMGILSAQGAGARLDAPTLLSGDVLKCQEPVYENYIAPPLLRRMSRIIRMGVTTGKLALQDAQCDMPDAIITGTGYGCLEDTDTFLTKMIRQNETGLNPTPFIQSTHNTIGSQLALMLKCYGYNQTYTQQGFSFEHAINDALLLLSENPDQQILVSGIDELIPASISLLQKQRCMETQQPLGEGAASFVLSGKQNENSLARIESVVMMNPDCTTQRAYTLYKEKYPEHLAAIDLVMSPALHYINQPDLSASIMPYGEWVGEFPVRSGYALAMAVSMFQHEEIGKQYGLTQPPKRILIHHCYSNRYHAFIRVEACQRIVK